MTHNYTDQLYKQRTVVHVYNAIQCSHFVNPLVCEAELHNFKHMKNSTPQNSRVKDGVASGWTYRDFAAND